MECARCGAGLVQGVCARCFLSEPLPSLVLGDLEVGEEIGRGGMSTVYRARNTALDRPAAVKLLPESLADDPAMVARFRREAQLLAKVDHPAVVRVFGAGSHEGVHWLEMELVEGEPVHARGPLAPGEAVAVVQQLCAALDAAHEVGVVHRDVKPANVLIRPDGSVKLVDFGIASSSAGRRLTRTGNAVGTPGFMAPEILSGAEPSKAMDVFAAGALLYTLMTGHPPEGAFEPPPAHAEAIRRALAPEPSARFATAGEFAAALSRPAQTTALHPGLPPDEVVWLRAAAAAWTLASAAVLYALLLCVTPKVYEGDVPPLVVQGVRELADGTKLSMARFEVMPLLVGLAVVLFLAAPAHGALLGRWRRLSLPAPSSEVRLAHGPWSFGLGVVLCGAYLGRIALETQGVFTLSPYVPLVAGLAEVAALWWFWTAVLEGTRRGRALMREPMVVFGFLLGLIPPVHNLARYLETLG